MSELNGKVKFPVKVVMPYNTGSSDWTNRAQVVEQQMENLLGKDYIDIILLPYPPPGFLNATRRAGNYSFMEVRAWQQTGCLLFPGFQFTTSIEHTNR
jgi:oligopeptide transport system substrate-binding protein